MVRLATLGCVLVALDASAQYVRTEVADAGHPLCLVWQKRDLVYRIDVSGSAKTPGDTEIAAVEAAFASWQKVSDRCSDFTFTRGPDSTARDTSRGSTAESTVIWREKSCGLVAPDDPCWADDDCSTKYDCWSYGYGTLALTHAWHSVRTGAISNADIELNGADQLFTTVDAPSCGSGPQTVSCIAVDVQNTMTHEIGHAVGFDHSPDPASTMYFWAAPTGEISKRVIDADTAEGFCTIYPRGGPPLPCDELDQAKRSIVGRAEGTAGCGCDSGGAVTVVFIALVLALRARSRFSSARSPHPVPLPARGEGTRDPALR